MSASASDTRMSAPWGQVLGPFSVLYPEGTEKARQGVGAKYWWNASRSKWTRVLSRHSPGTSCAVRVEHGATKGTLSFLRGFNNITVPAAKPGREPWKRLCSSLPWTRFLSYKMQHVNNTLLEAFSASLSAIPGCRESVSDWYYLCLVLCLAPLLSLHSEERVPASLLGQYQRFKNKSNRISAPLCQPPPFQSHTAFMHLFV